MIAYYNASVGSFINSDAAEFLVNEENSPILNGFSYCENNPIINGLRNSCRI